ncbi:aspartate ammonia-lyase [Arthrobacter sp. Hiyo1]|uniref:lyase family protein n=1 Tax=Arthrobacter sp. Hiyo1 TaxID=1588020 RepID=UPI0006A3C865|nr:lyase family protein [Arthrobacter sp. Hiyo1]GAP60763.1 aspartate ammonia-lyase [Arthrobacter sp. Hiyo1]
MEKDGLGVREIPPDVYWGIQTFRAVENFPITGAEISSYPLLVTALAQIKRAALLANFDLGLIERSKKDAIEQACLEIEQGRLREQFVVDPIQGGAGAPTNTNANEVIANRALERLGHERGSYSVIHPSSDVNMSLSTEDVYPTAVRIASIQGAQELLSAIGHLRAELARKAIELTDISKMGRTGCKAATPMTLGQEFEGYAVMLDEDQRRIREALSHLHKISLGATAPGTAIDRHPRYASKFWVYLREITLSRSRERDACRGASGQPRVRTPLGCAQAQRRHAL